MDETPSWFEDRVTKISEPQHESSFYGPLNKILSNVFYHDLFMVKPQSSIPFTIKIDKEAEGSERQGSNVTSDEEMQGQGDPSDQEEEGIEFEETSYHSYDTTLKERRIPDFLVVRVNERRIGVDEPRLLVEVKKSEAKREAAMVQIRGYLKQLELSGRVKCQGLLVMGQDFLLFTPGGRISSIPKNSRVTARDLPDRLRRIRDSWEY